MMTSLCAQCGYELDAFDKECPRCARGGALAVKPVARQSLKEYQARATELGRTGDVAQAIWVLKEAVEHYPDDPPTRNVLIGLLERAGRMDEANVQRHEMFYADMRCSEQFCIQYAWAAMNAADFDRAHDLFERSVSYHPNSATLREGMARICELRGDMTRAQSERSLSLALKARHDIQVRSANDRSAQTLENVGIAAGTTVGATGAIVGGGITLASFCIGGIAILGGIACCLLGLLVCLTCIGIPLGLALIIGGINVFLAGLAAIAGGTAVGTGVGITGMFTGGFAAGGALLSRKYRKEKQ